jgi:hypothetical protein
MTANLTEVTLEPVTDVPETASVCHFGEIEDSLQEMIVSAQKPGQPTITVDTPPQSTLSAECRCNVIKFTKYYSVNRM